MPIIDGATAPVFDIPGTRFTGLASPERGSQETCVWRVSVGPGTEPRFHQLTREEIFVALAGTAQVHIGGSVYTLNAGSAAVVPPGTDFAIANSAEIPFEALVVFPVGGQAVLSGEAPFTPPWAA